MSERWTGFGGKEAAEARNRQWEELWGAEDNYWGEEDEEEDEEEERAEDDDEQDREDEEDREDDDEDRDREWENMLRGNWADDEEEDFWEDEQEAQEKPDRKPEEKPREMESAQDQEEDPHLALEALRVLDRLKKMECPFLKGLYKSKMKTAKQFLCTPSIYRLDILAWLFTRLCPPFRDSFDTWQDSNVEEKIIDLTRLGHELMLCGPDDQDLIKGYAEEKQQLSFINELISLIESLKSEFSDNLSSVNMDVGNFMQKKMMLIKLFNPDMPKESIDPEMKPSLPGVESQYEKKENVCGKNLARASHLQQSGMFKLKAATEAMGTSAQAEPETVYLSKDNCIVALGMQASASQTTDKTYYTD